MLNFSNIKKYGDRLYGIKEGILYYLHLDDPQKAITKVSDIALLIASFIFLFFFLAFSYL